MNNSLNEILGKRNSVDKKTTQYPDVGEGKTYHSVAEKRLTEDITSTPIDIYDKEIKNKIVLQYTELRTNTRTFNAFSKRVLIRDDNGEQIIIDNHSEINKMRKKLSGKTSKNVVINSDQPVINEADIIAEEFDFD